MYTGDDVNFEKSIALPEDFVERACVNCDDVGRIVGLLLLVSVNDGETVPCGFIETGIDEVFPGVEVFRFICAGIV